MLSNIRAGEWSIDTCEIIGKVGPTDNNHREFWDGLGLVVRDDTGYEARTYGMSNRKRFPAKTKREKEVAFDKAVSHVADGYRTKLVGK